MNLIIYKIQFYQIYSTYECFIFLCMNENLLKAAKLVCGFIRGRSTVSCLEKV